MPGEPLRGLVTLGVTPNRVTVLRLALLPAVSLVLLQAPWARLTAVIAFALNCLGDVLDGWLARRLGMETPQGEVLDSLVDKLFFCIALLFLYHLGQLGIVGMSIAIMREFAGLAVDFWRFIGKRERARLGWDPPWAKWLGFLLPMAIVVNLLLLAVSPLAGVPEYMWWLGSLVLNFGIFARVSTVIFYLVRDRRLLRTLGFL